MATLRDVQEVVRRTRFFWPFCPLENLAQFKADCSAFFLRIGKAVADDLHVDQKELEKLIPTMSGTNPLCAQAEVEFGKLQQWLAEYHVWFTIPLSG